MRLNKLDAVAQAKLRTTCVDFVNQCNAIAKGRGVDSKGMNLAFSVLAKWYMQDMFNSYNILSGHIMLDIGAVTKHLDKIIWENIEIAWRDNYKQRNPEVKDESIPPIPTGQTEGQEEKGDTQSSGSGDEKVQDIQRPVPAGGSDGDSDDRKPSASHSKRRRTRNRHSSSVSFTKDTDATGD